MLECKFCNRTNKNRKQQVQHQIRCKQNPERIVNVNNLMKNGVNVTTIKENCDYCNKLYSRSMIMRHKSFCYLNPLNTKLCPICHVPIKNYAQNVTCSYKCSNLLKPRGSSQNEESLTYRTICFRHHGKKCLICSEQNIVAAHHVNENHEDNRPENLVPLCPTHHQYIHSRFRDQIQSRIDTYLINFRSVK